MRLFQTILLLILLTSCSGPIEKEQLIGRYVWNDRRTDTLEVRADGTYEYWRFKPGVKLANSGTWKLNSKGNEVEFERENFPFLEDHVSEGSWFSKVRTKDKEVLLLYKPGTYLRKVQAK